MTKQEIQAEALGRAKGFLSTSNYGTIYHGFIEKGIPESEILPRVNVFTYNAWKALGRQVKRGEKGVRVCTFRQVTKRDKDNPEAEPETFKTPWHTTVFHVSQTEPINGGNGVA